MKSVDHFDEYLKNSRKAIITIQFCIRYQGTYILLSNFSRNSLTEDANGTEIVLITFALFIIAWITDKIRFCSIRAQNNIVMCRESRRYLFVFLFSISLLNENNIFQKILCESKRTNLCRYENCLRTLGLLSLT